MFLAILLFFLNLSFKNAKSSFDYIYDDNVK